MQGFNFVFPDALDKVVLLLGAAIGAVFQFAFGGWTDGLAWLICFAIADWVTGSFAAFMTGQLNSDTGLKGIMRKVLMFAFVSLAHGLDITLVGMGIDFFSFMSLTVTALAINEAVSIVENIDRAGFGGFVPPVIRRGLKTLTEAAEKKLAEKGA